MLEGSVRKAGDRVRITAQLVAATTGHHLGAERYDRELHDLFALPDEVTQKIVLALKVKLTQEEQERFRRAPPTNLEAYDAYLRGVAYFWRFTPEAMAQARQLYEHALMLDPQDAAAYAFTVLTYFVEWSGPWSQDPQTLERAMALARRAIALDDTLPVAHLVLGGIYLWQEQYEQAITEGERALALDPNDADGHGVLALILGCAGRPEEAIGLLEQASRLNPYYPAFYAQQLGLAYRLLGRYEEAMTAYQRALVRDPAFLTAPLGLAVIYSELGREQEAQAEGAAILRINPQFSLEALRQDTPYKDRAVVERSRAALRKAGLE